MKTLPLALALPLGLALATSSCDLPSGDVTDPHTWGQYFLDKYEDERVVGALEPGPAPLAEPRVVLLITGVTIPAEWFDPIKARLERDGFVPVVYEPPDLLSGDLFENSAKLATVVDAIRAETGQEKIDILAECTGGLIARHYIQALGGDQYVSRMVTFISPQHGLPKAPLAYDYAGWPALDDLSPGSEFLETVNGATLPPNVAVTSIYTCTDEYIQPYETSIIPGATNIGLCDGFVGHFQFFYDPAIYLVMHGALTEPLAESDAPPDGSDDLHPIDAPGADTIVGSEGESEGDESSGPFRAPSGCSTSSAPPGDASVLLALGALAILARRRRFGTAHASS